MSRSSISRRSFLVLAASAAGTRLYGLASPVIPAKEGSKSLAGRWSFALDREDAGVKDGWFKRALPLADQINLPGILQMQGYGDDITAETPFVATLPRGMVESWYKLPQYAAYTKPGRVKVPFLSQPLKHYLGVAWYQRKIEIPSAWRGKRVTLTLERTRWQTSLFLNDEPIGSCHSLVAPHEYDLGMLQPGRHRISIRIDNRMILPYRPDGHSVSDAEGGGTWNGIVGRIELTATSPVWIDDAQVYPNLAAKSARVVVRIGNATGQSGKGSLTVGSHAIPVRWNERGGEYVVSVALPRAKPWSEFSPSLQRLTVTLQGDDASDQREITFGMREIHADGKHIRLNGELLHIRGTSQSGDFPLTGYPATDGKTWKEIIKTCQQWGLNTIRFHSWCPPEAAFTAADELGFYLQPDCGMWNSFDAEGKMLAILDDETARLLKAYGNHPSFVLLNATNEPAGHYNEQLPLWDHKWRETDLRHLYADGTGRPAIPAPGQPFPADYVVQNRGITRTPVGRGPAGWFGRDYEAAVHIWPVPCVGHEIGQWCAYPDFDVISKFKGYMVPGNYEIWRDTAARHGLLEKNKKLAHASGRFQLACYKEEIEASLRTPSYSGYELLDLHDYLGQGGALVGVLDAFWENKGYVSPEEYRQFNGETVILARFKERVFSTRDTLQADVELAHFGVSALGTTTSSWKIVDVSGNEVVGSEWPARPIPRGTGIKLGAVSVKLAGLASPARYKLVCELHGPRVVRNEWNFWLYPVEHNAATASDIFAIRGWDAAEKALASGRKVLYVPKPESLGNAHPKMSTVPIFWNRLMNPKGAWMLGLLCEANHPALAGFPTEEHCDWQWIDIAGEAHALNMNSLPRALEPIVQPIDDWNRSWKFGLLFECKVGPGQLIICSIDLDSGRAGAPSLKKSLLRYMASSAFAPEVDVKSEELRAVFNEHEGPQFPGQTSPDINDPGQIH